MGQTADQSRELAGLFATMADTVDAYRNQHFAEITLEERLRLEHLFQQLSDIHDQFTALAINDTLDEIGSNIKQIVTVTAEAQQSLKKLKTITEITQLVSAVAALGTDLAIADYGAIPQALKDLVQALSKKPEQSGPAG